MAILKCKMCGGNLELTEGVSVVECEYCGTNQTVPNADDEKKMNLFARANRLRFACEFDKAAGIYESIIADFPEEAEGYWGLVLCKYGIEYVDDPATAKKIPTCHRSSFESIMEDSDFEQALENADAIARSVYRNEAKQIEEIRKGIIEVSSKEEPYDIFICYKETAEDGQRTIDSVLAQDVYEVLTDKGYRVFFSRITLEDKLGQEYEPYIFAALNSAKIMLAFGTDYEYYNAVWVKNEWSRFLKLMEKNKEKHLIPCFKGIDAYDIPKEFVRLQAQDLGKVGAVQDLVRGIEKLIGAKKSESTQAAQQVVMQQTGPDCENLLNRVFMFLEDGDWESANEYCEKVLDIDSQNAEAYLGKLMADLHVKKQEDLKNQEQNFESNPYYQKIQRFGSEELRKTLEGYIAFINEREQKFQELADEYSVLWEKVKDAQDEKEVKNIIDKLSKERENLLKLLEAFPENSKKIAETEQIIATKKETIEALQKERGTLGIFSGKRKKEIDENIALVQKEIDDLWKKRTQFINALCGCSSVEEIRTKINETETKLTKLQVEVSEKEKSKAVFDSVVKELFSEKNQKYLLGHAELKKNPLVVKWEKGDVVNFGVYPQNTNKEKIEWIVLRKENGKALILSKYGLDCQPYNKERTGITWQYCTLRKWLNNDFLNTAFSKKEKNMIAEVVVSADRNYRYFSSNPGHDTKDRIFILSSIEAEAYFESAEERSFELTAYAKRKGANNAMWLRTPGKTAEDASTVFGNGNINEIGFWVNCDSYVVRPALWIDLNSISI